MKRWFFVILKVVLIFFVLAAILIGYIFSQWQTDEGKANLLFTAMKIGAALGNTKYQIFLGDIYCEGVFGAKQDPKKGLKLFKKAAGKGNAEAQRKIGNQYMSGEFLDKDYQEALKWYTLAANQNDKNAQNSIGVLYYYGYGVDKNYELAFDWHLKSAKQDDAAAQSNIAWMYFKGKGTARNKDEALEWFKKSLVAGNVLVQIDINLLYDSLLNAENKFESYLETALRGDALAQFYVGYMYVNGIWVEEDDLEALKWFEKSALQNNADAQLFLGILHFGNNKNIKKNHPEALKWLNKSADQGNIFAQYMLGAIYYVGVGVKQNYKEAFKWYEKAAESGIAASMETIASMCYIGAGVETNYAEALKWYEKAASQGSKKAEAGIQEVNKAIEREKQLEQRRQERLNK